MKIDLSPLRLTNTDKTQYSIITYDCSKLSPNLQYRINGNGDWLIWERENNTNLFRGILLRPRDYVEIKAIGINTRVSETNEEGNSCFRSLGESKSIFASGNVMSLCYENLNLENTLTIPDSYCFCSLFEDMHNLITPPSLPAVNLKHGCYRRMFNECRNLNIAPELPAKKLKMFCYSQMFSGCSSLKIPPKLPAKQLAEYCYANMFICSGIEVPPELPANILKAGCYEYMFSCSDLTELPDLNAVRLAEECYFGMFVGCNKLSDVAILEAPYLVRDCYSFMFSESSITKVICYASISEPDSANSWLPFIQQELFIYYREHLRKY